MTTRSLRLSKFILYGLIISLPINLGLHFIFPSAYVGGLLVDYLIPTLYVQDILAIFLCIAWVYEDPAQFLAVLKSRKALFTILLIYVIFLSTLLAGRFVPSFYLFLRWLFYAFVSLYISANFDSDTDVKFISKILSYWAIFLGILALGQYIKQGAIFNNYMFFGEQPYSAATSLIDKESFFGVSHVPSYGIFRHPNIFGGFLAISLVWILNSFRKKIIKTNIFIPAFLLGTLGLFLTFSYFSWATAILGLLLLFFEDRPAIKNSIITLFIAASVCGLVINKVRFPDYLVENPSVYKRIDLLEAGYRASSAEKYLFGSGINSSTVTIEKFLEPTNFLRFVQPPHNVFVMLVSEIGLVGTLLFLTTFVVTTLQAKRKNFFVFVTLLQILFMSSFDHYFVTIHQTFLLLWLTFGLVL